MVTDEIIESSTDRQLELVEHLGELRSRLIRCVVYVAVGMIAGWTFYNFFFTLMSGPVMQHLKQSGSTFLLTTVTEAFTIKLQMSLFIGIILALPLLTMEGWRFIAPGLTPSERKAVRLVAPLSVILFAGGVVLSYFALPMGIKWLIGQNPPGATFMPSVAQTLLFVLKMYLAFGLVFQMPVILMFLGRVGIISSSMLKAYWRHAIVAIGVIAAAVTPSGDAITMMMLCTPMFGLYLMSIWLVRVVEKKR